MQNYIGVKIVKAEPMTKGTAFPLLEKDDTAGYLVKYPDGYVSWSPKDVFEKAYRVLDCEDFIMQK